jgi:protein-disulfide isomerase
MLSYRPTFKHALLAASLVLCLQYSYSEIQSDSPPAPAPAPDASSSKVSSTTMDKAGVEKIIQSYISDHPEMIVQALMSAQKKAMDESKKKTESTIQENIKDILDPSTALTFGKGTSKVVVFLEPNCPHCRQFPDSIKEIMDKNSNAQILIRFLAFKEGSDGSVPFIAAAQLQNKSIEIMKEMQKENGPVDKEKMEVIAKNAGVDLKQMEKDKDAIKKIVEKNKTIAEKIMIPATPTILVGNDSSLKINEDPRSESILAALSEIEKAK